MSCWTFQIPPLRLHRPKSVAAYQQNVQRTHTWDALEEQINCSRKVSHGRRGTWLRISHCTRREERFQNERYSRKNSKVLAWTASLIKTTGRTKKVSFPGILLFSLTTNRVSPTSRTLRLSFCLSDILANQPSHLYQTSQNVQATLVANARI